MEEFVIKNIKVVFQQEDVDVRIYVPRKVILSEQNTENVRFIIEQNFRTVVAFYQPRIDDHPEADLDPKDLHEVSIQIVLEYLYMYNSWRVQYRRKKYDDLTFKEEDFKSPSTNDTLFYYYKKKYPDSWEEKCAVLLAMSLDELRKYYQQRLLFYNK